MPTKWSEHGDDALQEGIERLRAMARRISEAHQLVAETNHLLRRDRALMTAGPLHDARDLRTHASQRAHEVAAEVRPHTPARSRRRR